MSDTIIAELLRNKSTVVVAIVLLLTLPSMGPTLVLLYAMHTKQVQESRALDELIAVQESQLNIFRTSEERRAELAEFLKECVRGTWDTRGDYEDDIGTVGFAGAGWSDHGGSGQDTRPDSVPGYSR